MSNGNWIQKLVKAHDAEHAQRLSHFSQRRMMNVWTTGNAYPAIAATYPDVSEAFLTYTHKPEAPIIPERISQCHPMAH